MTDEAWIDTVRLARDMGDVSQLLPTGIRSLRDIPHTLLTRIRNAMVYLSFETLEEDDMPPRSIWADGGKLKDWFASVKAKHERRARDGHSDIDDPVSNSAADLLISR